MFIHMPLQRARDPGPRESPARRRKMPFVKISAVTGDGLPEFLRKMAEVIFASESATDEDPAVAAGEAAIDL
jgi:hypothetical protein